MFKGFIDNTIDLLKFLEKEIQVKPTKLRSDTISGENKPLLARKMTVRPHMDIYSQIEIETEPTVNDNGLDNSYLSFVRYRYKNYSINPLTKYNKILRRVLVNTLIT